MAPTCVFQLIREDFSNGYNSMKLSLPCKDFMMSVLVPKKDNFQILHINLMWRCNCNAWFYLLDFESTILHLRMHYRGSDSVWVGGPTCNRKHVVNTAHGGCDYFIS
jgi:hypothetical protein